MRVFADVYDTTGLTRLGSGPLMLISASVTRALDGVGSIAVSVPGTDDHALTLLQNKRRLRIFVEHDNAIRELGRGVIETLSASDGTNGWTLNASGPDDLGALKHTNTLLGLQYNTNSVAAILINLMALAGWGAVVTASDLISVRFNGVSYLKALQTVCAQQGLHFRLSPGGNPNTVEIGAFGADSGLRCFHVETINNEIATNDQVLIIESFKLTQDVKDLCNWLLPLGGGEGEARLTLQHSTRLGPYTIQTTIGPDGLPVYYISDSASITAYGRIQKVGSYQNITPLANTNADLISAANTLYDAAAAWLARYKAPLETYHLTVRKARRVVYPGDKIHIRYKGLIYREGNVPVAYRDINADMWVMECTESIDSGGLKLDLTVATIDRYELDAASVVISAIESVELRNVSFSPSPWKTDGTRAPLPTDDINAGYRIGSRWFYGSKIYDCTNNAPGAAVWVDVTASGAPAEATYITQTPNPTLTNEQALSALGTGLLKSTTGTGVLSIATGADLPGMVASGASHSAGAVPDPGASAGTVRFLREDATWQAPAARTQLTAARTYYVRADGNDSNTGLANTAGGAFLTIQKAIDTASALDNGGYDITIQVGSGTFAGCTLKSFVGSGKITILGDTATPANVLILQAGGNCVYGSTAGPGIWALQGVKLTGDYGVWLTNGTTLEIDHVNFGACTYYHTVVISSSRLLIVGDYTISGAAAIHWFAEYFSQIYNPSAAVITFAANPTNFSTVFAYSTNLAAIISTCTYGNKAYATGTRYLADMNAIIQTFGGGATALPGNAAGSTATGGQYA